MGMKQHQASSALVMFSLVLRGLPVCDGFHFFRLFALGRRGPLLCDGASHTEHLHMTRYF